MKKILALFLTLTLLALCIPVQTFAANEVIITGANFTEFTGGTGKGNGVRGVLFGNVGQTAVYEDVTFPETGRYRLYDIVFGYCSGAAAQTGKANILIDGEMVGAFEINDLAVGDADQQFSTSTVIEVEAGKHQLKVVWDIHSVVSVVRFGFKFLGNGPEIDFSRTEGAYRNVYIPAMIQAEDFDLGAGGSFGADGTNDGRQYREDAPVDIYKDADGGYYVGLNQGDSVTYTFIVQQDDAYVLKMKSKGGTVKAYIDDVDTPIEAKLGSSAGFSTAEIKTIYLQEGVHTIKLEAVTEINIDSLQFLTSTGGDYVTPDILDDLAKQEAAKKDEEIVHPVYKELYVSPDGDDSNAGTKEAPFKSIERARDELSQITADMQGDIIVNFLPGYHKIDKAIEFSNEHSGKNGFDVIFRGIGDGDEKPVIGGGTKITGWEQTENPEIYKAAAPDVEDTRTFYINGYMARRAMSKYRYYGLEDFALEGSQYKSDGIIVQKNNFPKFEHPEDLEMTQRFVWFKQRAPIKDIVDNGDTYSIVMEQPYWDWATTGSPNYGMGAKHSEPRGGTLQEGVKFFVLENAIELLDQPGEFFFDKRERVVYYYPYYEEDIETAETYVGTTEMMLRFKGESKENKMANIKLENLSFKHGAWNELSTTGKVTDQADKYRNGSNQLSVVSGGGQVPSQIRFDFVDGLQIKDCEFSNLGSTAVGLIDGVSNAKIVGSTFRDISGTGVIISTPDHGKYLYERPASEKPHDIEITNNVFRRCSLELTDTTAIAIYFADDISITHNYMADVPYSATTSGWGWATNEGTDIGCYNVDISYNHIVNNMQVTSDGGALYFLGNMFNSTVVGNFVDGALYGNGGVYFDGGSAFLTAKDNVVVNVPKWLKKNPWGGSCFAMDNFTNMKEAADIPSNHPADLITVTNTTYMTEDISAYPKAVEICENAGLTAEYKHLQEGTELPEWMPILWNWEPMQHFVGTNTWSSVGDYINYYDPDGATPHLYEIEMFAYTNTIGVTSRSEWQEYDIEIYEDGEYTLRMIAAQPARAKPGIARFWCDGEVLAEKEVPVVAQADYITGEFEVGKVYMTKGVHRIRVEQAVSNILPGAFMFDNGRVQTTNDYNYDEGVVEPCVPNVQPVTLEAYRLRFSHVKGATGTEDVESFEDVKNHWAKNEIGRLTKLGIIKGVSETEFAPDKTLSLYQAIWLSLRAAGIPYTDAEWKQLAVDMGMLTSVDEPDGLIDRERYADIVLKAYVESKGSYTMTYDLNAFADLDQIAPANLNTIMAVKTMGLITGTPDNKFMPDGYLTRAEAATVTFRLYNSLLE